MKDKAFRPGVQAAVVFAGLVVVLFLAFLTTRCKVSIGEAKFTGRPAAESAVLVNTGAGKGTGSVHIYQIDGKKKDNEGKSFGRNIINVIYLDPGEHILEVYWDDGNSNTIRKNITVTLPQGSVTEIGFEKDGDNIYYLFRSLDEEQLNELLSFAGGKRALLNDFKRKRSHLWERGQ
jgi:hypothetical protein